MATDFLHMVEMLLSVVQFEYWTHERFVSAELEIHQLRKRPSSKVRIRTEISSWGRQSSANPSKSLQVRFAVFEPGCNAREAASWIRTAIDSPVDHSADLVVAIAIWIPVDLDAGIAANFRDSLSRGHVTARVSLAEGESLCPT